MQHTLILAAAVAATTAAAPALAQVQMVCPPSTLTLAARLQLVRKAAAVCNLGRADEINLLDGGGALIDRLTYGDVTFPGTVRTQTAGGLPTSLASLTSFTVLPGEWVLATTIDSFGSKLAASGDVGNPGLFMLAVPEPATYGLLLAGLAAVGVAVRRRSAWTASRPSAAWPSTGPAPAARITTPKV